MFYYKSFISHIVCYEVSEMVLISRLATETFEGVSPAIR